MTDKPKPYEEIYCYVYLYEEFQKFLRARIILLVFLEAQTYISLRTMVIWFLRERNIQKYR